MVVAPGTKDFCPSENTYECRCSSSSSSLGSVQGSSNLMDCQLVRRRRRHCRHCRAIVAVAVGTIHLIDVSLCWATHVFNPLCPSPPSRVGARRIRHYIVPAHAQVYIYIWFLGFFLLFFILTDSAEISPCQSTVATNNRIT